VIRGAWTKAGGKWLVEREKKSKLLWELETPTMKKFDDFFFSSLLPSSFLF